MSQEKISGPQRVKGYSLRKNFISPLWPDVGTLMIVPHPRMTHLQYVNDKSTVAASRLLSSMKLERLAKPLATPIHCKSEESLDTVLYFAQGREPDAIQSTRFMQVLQSSD